MVEGVQSKGPEDFSRGLRWVIVWKYYLLWVLRFSWGAFGISSNRRAGAQEFLGKGVPRSYKSDRYITKMGKLLSGIFKWIGGKAVILILILAVIVVGAWIKGELKRVDELVRDRGGLAAMKDQFIVRKDAQIRSAALQVEKATAWTKTVQQQLIQNQHQRNLLRINHPVQALIPGTWVWRAIQAHDVQIALQEKALESAKQANELLAKQSKALILQIDRELESIKAQTDRINEALLNGYVGQVKTVVARDLPIAFGVLVGIILVPIGIKIFFFFVVAPFATGRRPIRILPAACGNVSGVSSNGGPTADVGAMSAVSQSVVLGDHQELLIQAEYLQSTARSAMKETKWLLNNSLPFASVLSGMYMLTKVKSTQPDPIVISATKESFSEVGILDLPKGAAFVCQPRALVGVIQDQRNPIRITRHWRLNSLQSWLTLQLRFLAFHGPGQLVMKGCRGIRIESAGSGRLINQAATMGFSANIEYGNTRCETFVSYWSGKEDLFNDYFAGESGYYVYEEMPDLGRTTGITGRGLEGFADAVLKVFGV